MSCGDPHDQHCNQVLANLYLFLDHELDDASSADIQHHLDECAPCLEHHELDLLVRGLVARSCHESAPPPLRDKVLWSIRQVVHTEVTPQGVTETRYTETRLDRGQGQGPITPF